MKGKYFYQTLKPKLISFNQKLKWFAFTILIFEENVSTDQLMGRERSGYSNSMRLDILSP